MIYKLRVRIILLASEEFKFYYWIVEILILNTFIEFSGGLAYDYSLSLCSINLVPFMGENVRFVIRLRHLLSIIFQLCKY